MIATPTVIAESATLNAQKWYVAPVDVDEIDDRSGDDAVDEVAGGAADDQRQADARDQLMVREARRVEADADERRRRDHRDDQPS